MAFAYVIPALDPDQHLAAVAAALPLAAHDRLVIVDDGSDAAHQGAFAQVKAVCPQAILLRHKRNLGKGAALKTAFKYLLAHVPQAAFAVTLDADGQHTPKDVAKVVAKAKQEPESLVLGTRSFRKEIPLRSRLGNTLTEKLVQLFLGVKIPDTQTGLRAVPRAYLPQLIAMPQQRYDFEFAMLLQAPKAHVSFAFVPIRTIYLHGNAGSHFHVLRDSIAIYGQFLRFCASSLSCFVLDIGIFALMDLWIKGADAIMLATIIARTVSGIANYALNRHLVFAHADGLSLVKYAILFLVQLGLSGSATTALADWLGLQQVALITLLKAAVDFVLFIFSYQIQKRFIFREGNAHGTLLHKNATR